jgi:hypothetical protein
MGELEEVFRASIRIRACVDQHARAAASRKHDADSGTMDARKPTDVYEGGGEHRSGVPRGDDGLRVSLGDRSHGADERGIWFCTDRLDGMLVHLYDVHGLQES